MDKKERDEIMHWGIKGQKWGRRRFQNQDGSLTPAGVKRYTSKNIEDRKKSGDNRDFLNSNTDSLSYKGGKRISNDSFNDMSTVPGRKALYKDVSNSGKQKVNDFLNSNTDSLQYKEKKNKKSYESPEAEMKSRKKYEAPEVNEKKHASDFSDKELAEYNRRAKLEEDYNTKYSPEAKAKAAKDKADAEAKAEAKAAKEREVKKLDTAGNIAKTVGNTIKNEGVSIAKAANKIKNAKEMEDYSKMTTAELKAKTERILAENAYVNASMAKTTAGQQKVEGFLTIAGNVVAITGGALNIAALWKGMQD